MKTLILPLLALAACMQSASASYTIGVSDTAPTVSGADIADLDTTGTLVGSQDYSNNNPPGQIFTTGSNADGYLLDSVTLLGGDSAGGFQYDSYTLTIAQVTPAASGYTATTKVQYSDFTFASGNTSSSAYYTFTLPASYALAADTTYAFFINGAANAYLGFSEAGETYAGGDAINASVGSDINPPGTFVTSSDNGYDRTFEVALTANEVPEPSTWSFLVSGLAGLIWVARRRLTS